MEKRKSISFSISSFYYQMFVRSFRLSVWPLCPQTFFCFLFSMHTQETPRGIHSFVTSVSPPPHGISLIFFLPSPFYGSLVLFRYQPLLLSSPYHSPFPPFSQFPNYPPPSRGQYIPAYSDLILFLILSIAYIGTSRSLSHIIFRKAIICRRRGGGGNRKEKREKFTDTKRITV